MPYILTLNNITSSDLHKIGYRALDLATVFQARYKTPLSFVVPNVVFDEFMMQTKLGLEVSKILLNISYDNDSSLKLAYQKIKELFSVASIPEEFLEPLKEAYNTLAIKGDSNFAQDLLSEEEPTVSMITSPDYLTGTEDMKGILMNINGFDAFLDGLKSSWLSMYSPEALVSRNRKELKEFNVGVIVQKMIKADYSCEAYSKGPLGDYEITVRAYIGLPDILKQSSKDVFSVSREFLKIESSRKARQEYKVMCSDSPNKLLKRDLGNRGVGQKLSDKEILEVARLTKRMNLTFNFHFKAYYLWKNEKIYFFMINRFPEQNTNSEVKSIVSEKVEPVEKKSVQPEPPEPVVYETQESDESVELVEQESDSEPKVQTQEPRTIIEETQVEAVKEEYEEPDLRTDNINQNDEGSEDSVEEEPEVYEEESVQEAKPSEKEQTSFEPSEEELNQVPYNQETRDSEDEFVVEQSRPSKREEQHLEQMTTPDITSDITPDTTPDTTPESAEEFILSETTQEEIKEDVPEEKMQITKDAATASENDYQNAEISTSQGTEEDLKYYREIVFEIMENVKKELHNRYVESFGITPQSTKQGIIDLHDKHGLAQKDDLLKLIIIASELNEGRVPDLNTISNIVNSANKFIGDKE